jgi:hypothetical protein
MQEFDPRRPTLRFAPKILVAVAGFAALGLGWKLTAGPEIAASQTLDPAAMVALQHAAFAEAEAQPGFDRGQNVNVEVLPGETLAAAVARSGVGDAEARHAVGVLSEAMDTVQSSLRPRRFVPEHRKVRHQIDVVMGMGCLPKFGDQVGNDGGSKRRENGIVF